MPSDLSTVKNEQETLKKCKFELNQSAAAILRNYEEKLENQTHEKEKLISDLKEKIISLQSKLNLQQIERITNHRMSEIPKQETKMDDGTMRNLWVSLLRRSKFEERIKNFNASLEHVKRRLRRAQQMFEKIETEISKEQILACVNEIRPLENFEWYNIKILEDMAVESDFLYLRNNITSLLQNLQQLKSNLQAFKIVLVKAYEKQMKVEKNQIATETTALKNENRDTIENSTEHDDFMKFFRP